MSVPFSNTHLRVPPGFGTLLEGLAREILRDQPANIPKYAAQHFEALLQQREESGVDPAEWAAEMEGRLLNKQAFKTAEANPEKEPATEATFSKENSDESQTEEDSSHSAEASDLSLPNVSENVDLTGSTEEENRDVTEKHIILADNGLSEEELVNRLPAADIQPDDLSGTEEEKDSTITTFDQVDRAVNERDSSSVPDQDIPQSELEPTDLLSFKGISNVDVCAQELATAEDEGGDKQETAVIDKEAVEEEKSKAEEPVEVFPFSGQSDVNVCAAELGGTERTIEGAQDDTYVVEEKTSKPQPKEAVVLSLPQSETQTGNQQEAEDQAEKTKEEEERETDSSSGAIHETLAHIEGGLDGTVIQKEDSLVEISFEDVPEPQQIKESEEKWTEEGGSVEVLETKTLEMQQEEISKEVTAVATDENISGAQNCDEPKMGAEKEVNSEGQEMESQHELSYILTDKVDKTDTNLNDSDDDEKGEGVKNISSSHLPTTHADEENPEDDSGHKNEDNEKVIEFHQNEDSKKETKSEDFKEEEITDTAGDEEDKYAEGYSELEDKEVNKSNVENQSSQQESQSNVSTAAMEAESETLEARAQHVAEENEESQGTLEDSQPEDRVVEKEATSKETTSEEEGLVEVAKIDFNAQKRSDARCEEGSISTVPSAEQPAADHRGEERPHGSEEDSMKPEGKSGDKQEECSRPQEEEDIMDIPLDDPEANRAAAKIQAGFRGHMTRKKMKPEDKAEGEEVSSTGDVLNGSQGDTETGGSGAVERDDTSVPEQ